MSNISVAKEIQGETSGYGYQRRKVYMTFSAIRERVEFLRTFELSKSPLSPAVFKEYELLCRALIGSGNPLNGLGEGRRV
jgi:hypothetical protein